MNYSSNEYETFLKKEINPYAVLLEAGQGKNINGNMFYILKELEQNESWKKFTPYYVVTSENKQSAQDRFAFYGFRKVKCVIIDSKEYKVILATAKYLFTDNSFPAYFRKRKEQIYVNTWHGTPIKYLGKSDICNSSSLGNVQKNYFMSDYALFPNAYTRDIFFDDYMLQDYFSGKIVLADYPRNEILYDVKSAMEMKKKLGYEAKEVFAYMPTWRGGGRDADAAEQTEKISDYLKEIDGKLSDHQVLMVNLHFLVDNNIDYSQFLRVVPFPKEYETYEVLGASDVLITDYSSVFFDYAGSGKRIVLFAYDLEEYIRSRGMYFDIRTLPFPLAETVEDLMVSLNTNETRDYSAFCKKFCDCITKDISNKLLQMLVSGDETILCVREAQKREGKKMVYNIGNIADKSNQALILEKLGSIDYKNNHVTVVFQNRINEKTGAFLKTLPPEISYVRIMPTRLMRITDQILLKVCRYTGWFKSKVQTIYAYEVERLMYRWEYDSLENLCGQNQLTPIIEFITNYDRCK